MSGQAAGICGSCAGEASWHTLLRKIRGGSFAETAGSVRLSCRIALCALTASCLAFPAWGEEGSEADRDHPAERAEWNAMLRRDRNGRVLAENRLKALDATCQMPVDPSMAQAPAGSFMRSAVGPSVRSSYTLGGTTWQSLGPQPMQSYVSGRRNWGVVAGRVDAIAIHATNSNVTPLAPGPVRSGSQLTVERRSGLSPIRPRPWPSATSRTHLRIPRSCPVTGDADSAAYEFTPSRSLGTYLGGGLLKSTESGDSRVRIDSALPPNAVLSRVLPSPTNANVLLVGAYLYPPVVRLRCLSAMRYSYVFASAIQKAPVRIRQIGST